MSRGKISILFDLSKLLRIPTEPRLRRVDSVFLRSIFTSIGCDPEDHKPRPNTKLAAEVDSLAAEVQQMEDAALDLEQGRCFVCHSLGHYAAVCPHADSDNPRTVRRDAAKDQVDELHAQISKGKHRLSFKRSSLAQEKDMLDKYGGLFAL